MISLLFNKKLNKNVDKTYFSLLSVCINRVPRFESFTSKLLNLSGIKGSSSVKDLHTFVLV